MTINCELCGRGTARKAITPVWWPHENVCDRSNCRSAARDAIIAIIQTRIRNEELVGAIAERHQEQMIPWGYRHDAMSEIDLVEEREWWANEVVKSV